ncbi:MAG TPA: isoprenylcysteine carboxylmethyltransferase family protein [Candidatus Sulfotelmatobacter sp.]|jgi:protein-S-isoprenylcysteine O-methyltransferase Ste14
MKTLTLWQIEQIPWYVFAAYWAITALRVKRTKARERSADRLVTVVVVVLAYMLLFSDRFRIGALELRFVPQEKWIAWVGIAVTWLGVAIAIWARYCIGEYWSARVTLKEGHQLIRSGPYAFVRHPIYTGMLLGCVGATLVAGEWRGIVAVVLLLFAHARKAVREERLLATEFGEEYATYQRSTGFLFPRWNLLSRESSGMDTHPGRS